MRRRAYMIAAHGGKFGGMKGAKEYVNKVLQSAEKMQIGKGSYIDCIIQNEAYATQTLNQKQQVSLWVSYQFFISEPQGSAAGPP